MGFLRSHSVQEQRGNRDFEQSASKLRPENDYANDIHFLYPLSNATKKWLSTLPNDYGRACSWNLCTKFLTPKYNRITRRWGLELYGS